jgi:2'-hydroxyisoflavone reductase
MASRRDFLRCSGAGALALGLAPLDRLAALGASAPRALDILVLGGTGFTGPHQVQYALDRGHRITMLNRNRRRPDLFKGKVDMIVGDLAGDVSALRGRTFDVVIDNPTTDPAWVRNAAQYLRGNVGHYVFISTISVYPDFREPGKLESAPLTPMPAGVDPYTVPPQQRGQYYGALKAHSEREVATHYPGIHTIIRPGLIVGPLDNSDRFTYWPVRIARGGEVLAPGTGNDAVQIIDARDLAEWTVRVAEQKAFGIYNAVGPANRLTMRGMLEGIRGAVGGDARFTWVPHEFLTEQKVQAWTHMPVWESPVGENAHASAVSNARALAAGLTFRPLAATAKDTLDWHRTRPAAEQQAQAEARRFGLAAAREAEVLAAWHARGR